MGRTKRPYIPKVKGCHECSQRRVHCDLARPSCAKCSQRGLKCSGYGTRYRFNHDLKASTDPNTDPHTSRESIEPYPSSSSFETELTQTDRFNYNSARTTESNTALRHDRCSFRVASLEILSAWDIYLLSHFSHEIASEMAIVDDQTNGWRYLVLPIAQFDDLVRESVLSASSYHFWTTQSSDPRQDYSRVVSHLSMRQDLQRYDLLDQQKVLLALLVLLATVVVSGSSDFPVIFQLLESAVSAVGGDDAVMHGELGVFLVRQIRKYRGYAAPFLGRDKGVDRLSLTANYGQFGASGWECFRGSLAAHPELALNMTIISGADQQACDLYVARARGELDRETSIYAVDRFIRTLDMLPAGSIGEQYLVFSIFMVALESVLVEHRWHLANLLSRHYRRNKFGNIPRALEYLNQVWTQGVEDWTVNLPSLQVLIV